MRPEETFHFDQIRKFASIIRGKVGVKATRDGMYGGVATWDRNDQSFEILKTGVTSEGHLKHVEVECLEAVDDLIKKKQLVNDGLIYLYLNKAPCADYNGNRKNCLEKVIKWAKNNPNRKLILGFRKPYAIGSFTERGSWHRPDKDIWPLYRMNLMCREVPSNLLIFSFVKTGKQSPELLQFKNTSDELNKTFSIKSRVAKVRKTTKEEDKLKIKLLKNQKEKIEEFDKEKHLIKSFILANRKQTKELDRAKKLVYQSSGSNTVTTSVESSSSNSGRSYKLKSRKQTGKSNIMAPIEVS